MNSDMQTLCVHHCIGACIGLSSRHFAEPNVIQEYPGLLRLEQAFRQVLQARAGGPGGEADGTAQDVAEAFKTLVVAWVRHPGLLLAWRCKGMSS